MPSINSNQQFAYPAAENAHFIKLDVSDMPELTSFPQGAYAILTYPIIQPDLVADNLTSIEMNTDEVETLLSSIDTNTDGVKGLLTYIGTTTDGIEGLLSSIEMNTDEVETLLSSIDANTDGVEGLLSSVDDNTAYQDVPFNTQLSSVSNGSADQITSNAKKGWMTISVDTDSSDVVYVGDSGVTTSNGYILKSSNPSLTVSTDNLSEWYVTGASGGEVLYVVGAYLN